MQRVFPVLFSENSITIAALAAAVAMTVGVSVMVFSFRETVESWINDTLTRFFIARLRAKLRGFLFFPSAPVEFLASHPAVETVDTFAKSICRWVNKPRRRGSARRRARHFQFVHGNGQILCVASGRAVRHCFRNFARRHRRRNGESIELTTPDGVRKFPIAGIFYDYSRDQGIVYISQRNFVQFWHDDRVNSVAVYLKETVSSEALIEAFRQHSVAATSSRSTRTGHCARAFSKSRSDLCSDYVLRTIAVSVAITGIFLS